VLGSGLQAAYNNAVPAHRKRADVPLGGEVTRQKALLNELFARVSEAIVLLDTDDRILRVNPEFTRIFGYAEEEALGRPINELVVPEELWAEAEEYTRRGTRGEILNVETMRKRKDGTRVPVSIVGVPVSIAGSQISEYVIYRDITERKRAEQTLRESEAYLAEAQRLSQTGSWAWNPSTGDIRYWSEECYRVLGFDPHGPLPRFETFFQQLHPDDQAHSRERFDKAIRDKADFEMDYRIVHPDKGVRDIHVVGHAVLDRSGDLGEFVGTVIDVTERKRAEQELQQLVDFVSQLIVVFDSDGKVIHANRVAREYTGLTLEEFRSLDVFGRVIHPDDEERVRAARKHGFAGSEPFELDSRLLGKDGIHRWFLGRYNPFVEEGRVRRWYVSATEIESRKQEEERIRQENVRLEERTRIAQELHDTLLQTIQSASLQLSVAVDGVPSDSPAKSRLDRILQIMGQGIEEGRSAIQGLRSSGSQTSDLVLALSRIQQELEVRPDIDFRVVVTGRQQQLPPQIQNEIYRIGREALVNAFCHSGAKRVELELEYSDSELRMRVCDNGCGIDPQVLEKGRNEHWGLAGMRERATRIGGLVKILSSPMAGTEVQLSIPTSIASELSLPHHSSG
jgi:PAS domain S-box-containing protein